MKFIKLVVSLVVAVSVSTFAAHTGYSDRTSSAASPHVANMQEVLDRNFNPYFAMNDYYTRIKWSGMVQAMAGVSSVNPEYMRFGEKKTVSDIVLPRADIYMDAMITDWASAHVALSMLTNVRAFEGRDHVGRAISTTSTSGVFARDDASSYRRYHRIDEAVITLGDFNRYPVFFRAGLGRIPFGNYKRNVYPVPLVTIMTETQVIYAQTGFVDKSGINGSVYVFTGSRQAAANGYPSDRVNINNFGLSLGYCTGESHWGMDIVLDYLYNMAGAVNAFHSLGEFNAFGASSWNGYDKVVGGAHGAIKFWYNGYDGNVSYVTALSEFGTMHTLSPNQRPSALHVEAGYSFPIMEMNSRFGAQYQMSFNGRLAGAAISGFVGPAGPKPYAAATDKVSATHGIPEFRVQLDYTVDLCKNLVAGVHGVWSRPYTYTEGDNTHRPDDVWTGLLSLTARLA